MKKKLLIAFIITLILELILLIYGSINWRVLCKMCDPTLIDCPPCPTGFGYAIRVVGLTFIPLFLIILLIEWIIEKIKNKRKK